MTDIRYCLYARKSSESDERQAMSIDGQISEMLKIAKREKVNVVETITESHSAKESGQRPEFNILLSKLYEGKFNAILTWAPDRLSRNAGDLGRIVDLMDQGKLLQIKTYSQSFTNNPNEKFLLMILCSQAKLENDNRGVNVKRGLRNKCEFGIRPGLAPIGYTNVLKANRISTVEQDPQRAPIIKEIFEKVAYQGYSGRMVKKWLDDIDFRTKSGCRMPLSKVYVALQNPFYYGEFQYGDKWYKGTHKPLISKTLFEKVQIQLQVAPKQWNKQLFPFKKICKCGSCGGSVTAEIKYRRTKANQVNTHIYYHCNRIKKYDCKEPYITEQELITQLIGHLPEIKLNTKYLMTEFETEVKRLQHLKATVIDKFTPRFELTQHNTGAENIDEVSSSQTEIIREYLLHVLQYGTPQERLKILGGVKSKFQLRDRQLFKVT
ncbi:MAG: site-specific recombinase [Patescibacteria group bacterium]|nr:site-specific recombinase [Patescibacteria group bacterium]